jgi:WD40 repeat protein
LSVCYSPNGKTLASGNKDKTVKLWDVASGRKLHTFAAALTEAENFGPQDTRLATSLNNLASVYDSQGKYAEAQTREVRRVRAALQALLANTGESVRGQSPKRGLESGELRRTFAQNQSKRRSGESGKKSQGNLGTAQMNQEEF